MRNYVIWKVDIILLIVLVREVPFSGANLVNGIPVSHLLFSGAATGLWLWSASNSFSKLIVISVLQVMDKIDVSNSEPLLFYFSVP